MRGCEARQQSDQMCCNRCGTVWDMNDPDPPECKTDEQLHQERGHEQLNGIKEQLAALTPDKRCGNCDKGRGDHCELGRWEVGR